MNPTLLLPRLHIILLTVFFLVVSVTNATDYYSKGNLAANVRTNWSSTTNGSGASPTATQFTASGHTFFIQNGHDMTTTAAWVLASNLQINAGGSLTTGGNSAYTLTISGTTSVSGTIVLNNVATKTFTGTTTVNSGGIFTIASAATVNFSASLSVVSGGTFNHNNTYDNGSIYVQVNGDLSINGTYSYGAYSPVIYMNGTGTKYINTGTTALCKFLLRQGNYYANGTVTVTKDFFAMWDMVGGSFHTNGQTVNANWGIVNNGGTFYVDGGTLNVVSAIGGMLIGRTATQNGDLQVSSGTINTPGIYLGTTAATPKGSCTQSGGTINTGILDIGTASTFVQSGGTNNVNGPLNLNDATSAYSHTTGSTTLNIAGNFLNNGLYVTGVGTAAINIAGSWTNNFTFTTSATNTVTFNGTGAQTLGGTAATIFNDLVINPSAGVTVTAAKNSSVVGNLTVTSGTLDLSTYTCNRTLVGGGAFSLAAGTTLKLAGGTGGAGSSNFPNNFSTNTLAASSLVEYNGTGAQTVYATPTYGHLTLSAGNTKTAGAGLTITGNLNINTTASFAGSSFTHNIAGNWYNNVSATAFTAGTSTVNFNGSTAQVIGGTAASAFSKLTINNAAGVTLAQDQTVSSQLTLTAGLVDIGSNNLVMGSAASAVAGTPFSATKMVIADGGGEMRKNTTSNGLYLFPIGDKAAVAEYSPITLAYTGSAYTGAAYLGVKVNNDKHASNASITDFLKRYWTLSNSGITSPAIIATATYTAADIAGTEGSIAAAKYTALPWIKYGVLGSNTLTTTAITNTGTGIVISGITNAVPNVAISGGGVSTCAAISTVLASTVTNNGTSSFTYDWSPATGLSAANIANPTAAPTTTTIYTLTVTDGNGITANKSTTITIDAAPSTPAVAVTQPTCATASATITISAPTGAGITFSTDGSIYSNTTGIFTGITSGGYNITAKNTAGCVSAVTPVTVNVQPLTPATPTVSVTAQPTCATGTGTITITAPAGGSITYSTNGVAYTNTTGVFTSMAPGTYNITAKNSVGGCISNAATVTVNAQPVTPATPSVSVTVQPSCTIATGTITITAPTGAGITYSTNGSTYTNTTGVFTGMGAGTYSITARSSGGCTSTAASVTVNPQPAVPATPTASVILQPTCLLATGTISVTAPLGLGMSYSTDGSNYTNTLGLFTAMPSGTYNVTAKNSIGCISAPTAVTMNAQPIAATGLLTGSTSICSGGSATISIVVTGLGTISGTLSNGTAFSGTAPIITVPVNPGAATTYTISTLTNGACVSSAGDKTGSFLVSVTNAASALISYASTPFCWNSGTAIASITGSLGGSYTAFPAGASINASTGSIDLATSAPGLYTVSYTIAAIGGCGIFTTTAPVTINPNTWTGQYSNDWNLPANWAGNSVPMPSCPDVTILATAPFKPQINSGSFAVENLYLKPGATLTVNNATLKISGTINNAGTFDVSNGTIELNGSSSQTIPANAFQNNALKNLIISNSSVAGVSLAGDLDIYGALTYSGTGKKFNTNNMLTLKSTASGTARVGVMTGNTIAGKVTVERYISLKRAWRLLSVPTNSNRTIRQTWQENAANTLLNPVSGYGIQITTNAASWASSGFDLQSPAGPSLKKWNVTSGKWDDIGSTLIPFPDPAAGYFTFVRGDRTASVLNSPATITTLRTKGDLYIGDQTPITIGGSKWACIGNPYASAIDMRNISKTGVKDFFYVWDPKLSGTVGLGAWQTFSKTGADYVVTPGLGSYGPAGTISNYIQSGQGFFVEGTSGGGSVTLKEAAKSNGSILAFRPVAESSQLLRANLFGVDADGGEYSADGVLINYDNNYANSIDEMDALKSGNTGENLGIKSNGKVLVIERRKTLTEQDTVFFNLKGVKVQSYRFEVIANLQDAGVTGFIEDNYLQTKTSLNLGGNTDIHFKVENVPASYALDRFRLVFAEIPLPPFVFKDVKAYSERGKLVVQWKVDQEQKIVKYEVESSTDSNTYILAHTVTAKQVQSGDYSWRDMGVAVGDNYYRIKAIDVNGKIIHSKTVKVAMGDRKETITVYPNPIKNGQINLQLASQTAGLYTIKISNPGGQVMLVKTIYHAGGTVMETISLSKNMQRGVYLIQIITPAAGIIQVKAIY